VDPVWPATPATTAVDTPPPPPPRPPTEPAGQRRGWRDRLPEVAATIGSVLVVAAVTGFVTSSWEELTLLQRAVALAAVAVGLSVGGAYVEGASRRALDRVTSLVYLSASCAVAASVTLAAYAIDLEAARLGIAAGGLAAAIHAGWVLLRDPSSPTRTGALALALLYGAGPAGLSLSDRFSTMDPIDLGRPLVGAVDPTVASDAFLVPGVAWVIVGAALLALATHLTGRARHTATVLATGTLFSAALMLNVLTDPVGAFAALCIVLGYLVYGYLTDQAGIQLVGAVGVLLAGIRVLWGLFSGQLAVTVAVLVVGLTLLAYALRAARDRAAREQGAARE
jgi:uncharacterized membrane protein